jgi:hypothetical protein
MTMDDEHVFRELGGNGGGLLGCRFFIGDLVLEGLNCSIKKFDCLQHLIDGNLQRPNPRL